MIHDLDIYVGRVIAALEQARVLDRTLIVFTSEKSELIGRTEELLRIQVSHNPVFPLEIPGVITEKSPE